MSGSSALTLASDQFAQPGNADRGVDSNSLDRHHALREPSPGGVNYGSGALARELGLDPTWNQAIDDLEALDEAGRRPEGEQNAL